MAEMTSRERVFCALEHKEADRCPVDMWLEETTTETALRYFGVSTFEELLDLLKVDLQLIWPRSLGPGSKRLPDGSWIAEDGAHVRKVKNDFSEYLEYIEYPLGRAETVDDLLKYDRWPDAKANDWAHFAEDMKPLHEKRVLKLATGGLFEKAWHLRGQQQYLMDMALDPEIPHYIMEKLTDYWCEYVRCALNAAGDLIDIVYTYDDIATQNSLIMSPTMLEEFVYPYHRRLNEVIHSYGKRVLFHSCGSVISQVDALASLPIDILNPLQPLAKGMDLPAIKEKWGDRLSFHGGIDIQHLLPHGTPEEVREAVRATIRTLGKGGGYIMTSAHNVQNDTPMENLAAMYDLSIR